MDTGRARSGDRRSIDRWLWLLAAVLAIAGGYKVVSGIAVGATRNRDIDLQARSREYSLYREGTYPNARVEPPPAGSAAEHSVYPPYAFPMLSAFFEPGRLTQGRFVVWSLSIVGLAVMGAHAYRTLRPAGPAVAAVGLASVFAVSGNKGVMMLGQFSIICVTLIVLQMSLLARGRPLAAGMCWALAMLKPHIAFPFGILFLMRRRHATGLVLGIVILAGLSWLACVQTGIAPAAIAEHWLSGLSLAFSADGFLAGPGAIAERLGIDHRIAMFLLLGCLLAGSIPAVLFLRRLGERAMLPLAALCAGIGMFGVYHRLYDEIMLYPVLLANLVAATASRRPIAIVMAVAMLLSLLPPMRYVEHETVPQALLAAVWVVACIAPLASLVVSERRRKAACT